MKITKALPLTLLVLIAAAINAAAATFVVANANDRGPGSLRDAVNAANNNGETDTIVFDAEVFRTPRTITLTEQILISNNFGTVEDVTITGPGADLLTISGNGVTRIFGTIQQDTISISGMTLTGGYSIDGGGAISNGGVLTLSGMVFAQNTSSRGGAIYNIENGPDSGVLNVNGCFFRDNTTFGTNINGEGGSAIASRSGTLNVTDSGMTAGTTRGGGGGLRIEGGVANLRNTTISNNSSGGAGNSDGGGGIYSAGNLTLTNCIISGNTSGGTDGAGIYNELGLTVIDTIITNNTGARHGGGIYDGAGGNHPSNFTRVTNSTISHNAAGTGGGVYAENGSNVTVSGSAIHDNRGFGKGGGFWSAGASRIDRSTISRNTAGVFGGLRLAEVFYDSAVTNSTIANNTATIGTGGGLGKEPCDLGCTGVTIGNTIISGNSPNDLRSGGGGQDVPIQSAGYSLVRSVDTSVLYERSSTDLPFGTDPHLGELQDNGGGTLTHAPKPGSPVIDRGKRFSGANTDQRGVARPTDDPAIANADGGDGSDIGAVELGELPPVVVESGTPQFFLVRPQFSWAHDITPVEYITFGPNAAALRVDVVSAKDGVIFPIAANQSSNARLDWDTTEVPDGIHEVRAIFRDAAGLVVGERIKTVFVNNAATWHSGTLSSNETWSAGTVHIVERDVAIPNGVTLTIEAGAVVKFVPAAQIVVMDGGTLDADAATEQQPTVLTAIADDSAGGDTNFDGEITTPRPGDWRGVSLLGTGKFLLNAFVDVRYAFMFHSGTLAGNETWRGDTLHRITANVTVPAGMTLEIAPGAIVKFNPATRLVVPGTLNARGTYAQPIVFTSIRDDAHGGDSNSDGNTTLAAAGDWGQLAISGNATMEHCKVLFGSSEGNVNDGMIRLEVGGSLIFRDGLIDQALYDGFSLSGGQASIENSVVLRSDRGISAAPGSTVTVKNSTVHDCRQGLHAHGGAMTVVNCLVTNSGQFGINYDLGNAPTVSSTDVFGSATANYNGFPDQTGQNGNVSVDPKYRNAEQDEFRLQFASPVIDAAEGAAAPITDSTGAPRYDDPRTANTGSATGTGAFADLGAFEFVEAENIASNLDLAVSNVSGPVSAIAGELVTVSWTIRNAGSETIVGPWFDTVGMTAAGGGAAPIFAGEFQIGTRVVLGPGQTFTARAQVRVPGAVLGRYQWQVFTNSRGTVFEGRNSANNAATGIASFDLDLPELVLDTTPLSRSFTAVDQPLWFKVRPGSGKQVRVSLDLDGEGVSELYVSRGRMPTRQNYDAKQAQFDAPDVSVTVAGTHAQVYYVLAYPAELSTTPQAFTISAQNLPFSLDSLTLTRIGSSGRVTIGFNGALLPANGIYELIGPGGTVMAVELSAADASRVFATFDLDNLAPGTYTARITIGGRTVELPNAVTVEPVATVAAEQIQLRIVGPPAVRAGRTAAVRVEVKNVSNLDVYAPLLRLTVDGWAPKPRAQSGGVPVGSSGRGGRGGSIEIIEIFYVPPVAPGRVRKQFLVMPLNPENPAGTLPPGFTSEIVLDGIPELDSAEIQLFVEELIPGKLLDHPASKAAYKPADMPDGAWEVIYANFIAALGDSTTTANATLARSANFLSSVGQRPSDVQEIFSWELRKASDFDALKQRWKIGAFGYGSNNPETRLSRSTLPNGDEEVLIAVGGRERRYLRAKGKPAFAGMAGDTSVLTKLSETSFELRDAGAVVSRFETAGATADELLLTYIDDPQGHRLSFGYTGGRLTSTTDDNGKTRTVSYNPAGRVQSTTNEFGLTVTFAYDAANEHLTAVTDPMGVTIAFEYYKGEGIAREHALKSKTVTGAGTVTFEYDSRGRLSRYAEASGAEATSFTYDEQGGIEAADAEGNVSRLVRDPSGRIIRLQNPGQAALERIFDPLGNLVETRVPGAGVSLRTFFDDKHHARELHDAEGNIARLDWDNSLDVPTLHTDRRGHTTTLEYESGTGKPNLTGIVFPGGAAERRTYDSKSRLQTFTNARGQQVVFGYNAQDQLITKTYPNGNFDEFFYDPATRQNTSVVRHLGATTQTTTFEYYETSRLLKKVTYPDGRFIIYTHDSLGRRETITTSDGYTDRWEYDGNNRLWKVKNGAGVALVTFSYDSMGRVESRTLANGASTAFTFTGAEQVETVTHRRPDQSIIAVFTYEYDLLGLCRALTGPDGRAEYDYDRNGRMSEARLPGGRVITYAFDPEGNRTSVTDNGVVTPYSADHLNRYSSVGGDTFAYDDDGHMTARTSGGITTTYTYDVDGNLTGMTAPGETWTYEWNPLGHLVATTHNGVRTEFLIDPLVLSSVVGEYTGGNLVAHYAHGGGLGARIAPGGDAAFYLFDGGGHTSHLLGSDGATLNSYRYLPFGEANGAPVEAVPNPFRYGGRYGMRDEGNGLVHARARHYSPSLGRFISRDPTLLPLGNTYHYSDNSPISLIDFNGAEPLQPLSRDEQTVKNANDAAALTGLALTALQAANQDDVNIIRDYALTRLDVAGKTDDLVQLTIGERALECSKTGPAAKRLAKLEAAGKILGPLGILAEANQVFAGDGTKPGVIERLYGGDSYDKGFAAAEGVLFVSKTALKAMTAEIPFSGELIDGGIIVTDYGSQLVFGSIFSSYYGDEDPEEVFGEAYFRLKKGTKIAVRRSDDPNDITGPSGFGSEMWIDDAGLMHFTIRFENKATADAAAYRVEVTLPLDAQLDASTFAFDQVGFAGTVLSAPPGQQFYATRTSVTTDPNPVKVIAKLDAASRTVTWLFESFDDETGDLPEDPLAGFLPPNNAAGIGEGFATFTIRPVAGAPHSSDISAQASIVFDTNDPIVTNIHRNGIDNLPPSSAVLPLAASQSTERFAVNWGGSDAGSGIIAYTIFVSENNGPFNVWLDRTAETSALFQGAPNVTYSFYSIAEDGVGFVERAPGAPDATTTIQLPVPTPTPTPTSTVTPAPTATPTPTPAPLQLLNIATRLNVQTGENVLIGGVIVMGTEPKKVIIRAIGPSLSEVFDGVLSDPALELYAGDTLLASNDNWKDMQQTEIEDTTIPPSHDLESAVVYTLAPGSYTAVMSGQDGATGIGVIEAYDLDQTADSGLANISSRGLVESGEDVMIGGLIVGGNGTQDARILIRAIGPSLGKAGVEGALQDPTLELRDSNGELVSENDNWQETQPFDIEATTIAPSDPAESAIMAKLPSGNYTAIVRGKNDSIGVGLVEVYNLP